MVTLLPRWGARPTARHLGLMGCQLRPGDLVVAGRGNVVRTVHSCVHGIKCYFTAWRVSSSQRVTLGACRAARSLRRPLRADLGECPSPSARRAVSKPSSSPPPPPVSVVDGPGPAKPGSVRDSEWGFRQEGWGEDRRPCPGGKLPTTRPQKHLFQWDAHTSLTCQPITLVSTEPSQKAEGS